MAVQPPIGADLDKIYKQVEKDAQKLDSLAQGVATTYLDKVYQSMVVDQLALEELRLYLDLA